jgi:Tol biopolymer transport system component
VALGVAASGYWPRVSATGPRALQFDIPVVDSAASRFTLSPDGRYLAYFAPGSGGFDLWLRDLSRAMPERLIENAGSASWLAWSGDARSVMAGTPGGLRRFEVETGNSLLQRGGWSSLGPRMWLSEGRFLVGVAPSTLGPLAVESAAGQERTLGLDVTVQEIRHALPAAIDNAGTFSYSSIRKDGSRHVCIARLETAPPRCVGPVNHDTAAWYFNGSLVYARGGTLIARGFDLENVRFAGEEQSLADGLVGEGQGIARAASRADTVAFAVGGSGQRLVWRVPSGGETAIRSIERTTNMALSPDGRRVLVREGEALVMLDLTTGGSSRLGPTLGDPIWSPDGRRLAHRTATGVVMRSVENPEERVILDARGAGVEAYTEDWSPDGQWLAVGLRAGDYRAALIPVAGGEPVRFLKNSDGIESADEFHFSPSGKWIAFNAVAGDRSEVFVVANPPTAQRWQVSTRGGMQARWRPSSNTLHYLEQDGTMMEVAVQPGDVFSVRERKALFKVGFIPSAFYDD